MLADAAILPLAGELFTNGNGAHSLFDPVVRVAFSFVEGTCTFGSEFGILDLLNSFVANLREPALEGLCLGAGNGLDEAEDALGIPALKHLPSAR